VGGLGWVGGEVEALGSAALGLEGLEMVDRGTYGLGYLS